MTRRSLTLSLGVVLAVVLAVLAAFARVPYVELTPGPAFNTLGTVDATQVLTISGAPTYPTTGRLDLTTVDVTPGKSITLGEALAAWVSTNKQVVPTEVLYPPDQTDQQIAQTNTMDMQQSQDDATTAALTQLGLATTRLSVGSVAAGSPATGRLQVADVLTSVDGTPVTTADDLRAQISKHQPGEQVTIGFLRAGKPGTAVITTVASTGETPVRPLIGITPSTRSESKVSVSIQLKDVGGPSAGLMFALGIIDKLGPDSLTGGRNIAGTGTISPTGQVGEIGGIAEKLRGAKAVGATVFLVPDANCAEAKEHSPGHLELVRVKTLAGALVALGQLRADKTPISC